MIHCNNNDNLRGFISLCLFKDYVKKNQLEILEPINNTRHVGFHLIV